MNLLKMKFENTLDYFVFFIIFIKFCFVILYSFNAFLIYSGNKNVKLSASVLFWKERTEFIFIACMSFLLMYHFLPQRNVPYTKETSILFFLFGFIMLFTAKWSIFFQQSKIYQTFVKAFAN